MRQTAIVIDSGIEKTRDPRPVFAGLLATYLVLGWALWGINRSPLQAGTTVAVAMLAESLFNRWMRDGQWQFPWSGMITGFGLCLLLNYGANPWLPILPALLAIASKSLFSVEGRHFFNPALFGLIVGMWLSGGMLSPAPAYQWGGSAALIFVGAAIVLIFVYPHLKAKSLVAMFLILYFFQAGLRAWIMRSHLPPEAVFFGSITSPAFFLFTFYMLTDPKTTPRNVKGQAAFVLAVVGVDLLLHFRQSYSTLFPALFVVQAVLYIYHVLREGRVRKQVPRLVIAAGVTVILAGLLRQGDAADFETSLRFEKRGVGIDAPMSRALEEVDPRVAHIAKWILSVGDAVAVADVDNDGWQDVFLTYPLKVSSSRAALFRNIEGKGFERVPLPVLDRFANPKVNGLPSTAVFADIDNDGDQDLFLGVGYGECRLLLNMWVETGVLSFRDVTELAGISGHSVCLAATFFDADGDGDLDLLVANAVNPFLEGYDRSVPLNPFDLPKEEYEGDRRMFRFMHSSWHDATNGGLNQFYRNRGDGTFEKLPASETGLKETHWSLAVNTADFDGDGLIDLYVASDFGPDDCYRNLGNCRFERIEGKMVGTLGRDTYKGMNVSIADFNSDGRPDVYVSNVHAPLQAEGSLFWINRSHKGRIKMSNEATKRGVLNAHRFGWGAAVGDLDLDGWPDIVQCNGMVDDAIDRRFDETRDYWYANARLARTGPDIHAYADQWGDLRGYSIWGKQRSRVLLNRGGYFKDAAVSCGLGKLGNARGAVLTDFDNDGDLDLLMTHQFASADFYENAGSPEKGWIGIALVGNGGSAARDALGARVQVGGRYQWVNNVSGFSAQQGRRLLFATDDVDEVEVRVQWPDGSKSKGHFETGKYIRIEQEVSKIR
ncbi:MAG: FG-GAP-like repeat-containing protein [Verrucomicrobiota bacterium]